MNFFGDSLRHQREAQRLSQCELADLSGCPLETLQWFEASHLLPSKIQMEQLSSVERLGLTYESLKQWKQTSLQEQAQEISVQTAGLEKWQCSNRQWDCPCCLWPYTLQCDLRKSHPPASLKPTVTGQV